MTSLRRRLTYRRLRRNVARLARTHTAIWLTAQGPTLTPPPSFNAALCHICQHGRPTLTDRFTGTPCCDHCGAASTQLPGALPLAGVAATEEHRRGACSCRSLHRPDLDWREHERAGTGMLWAV